MQIFNKTGTGYTPRIRIINLVDILLVLLLFLFVTTTFRVDAPTVVKVALPETTTAVQRSSAAPKIEKRLSERIGTILRMDEKRRGTPMPAQ